MPVAAGLRDQISLSLAIAGKFIEETLRANRESPWESSYLSRKGKYVGKAFPNVPNRPIRFDARVQEQTL